MYNYIIYYHIALYGMFLYKLDNIYYHIALYDMFL